MKEKWLALVTETISKINEIDNATPYQAVEPEWWLEMMKVRRLLYSLNESTGNPTQK